MSRIFGPVTQNGYVVRDLDAAVRYWIDVLGVGPFYMLPPITFESYRYRGIASHPELRVAVANSGHLQIELIEQVNDAPSFYRDFLENVGAGLQHLSVWSTSYDEDTARILRFGGQTIQDGVLTGGIRFAYYGTDPFGGGVMEVLDTLPHLTTMFSLVREAASNWDGTDPIRTFAMS